MFTRATGLLNSATLDGMRTLIRMSVRQLAVTAGFLALAASNATACSCMPHDEDSARIRAKAIYIAKWTSAKRTPIKESGGVQFYEDVQFVVTEVFKGSRVVGDLVATQSRIGPGACGASVRNSPEWLIAPPPPNSKSMAGPLELSKSWLIYENDAPPFELSICGQSRPLNGGGEDNAAVLRKRTKVAPKREH